MLQLDDAEEWRTQSNSHLNGYQRLATYGVFPISGVTWQLTYLLELGYRKVWNKCFVSVLIKPVLLGYYSWQLLKIPSLIIVSVQDAHFNNSRKSYILMMKS